MTPEQIDSVKFLKLLIDKCDGADTHKWSKCPRCLAFHHLEHHHDKIGIRLIKTAIEALENG